MTTTVQVNGWCPLRLCFGCSTAAEVKAINGSLQPTACGQSLTPNDEAQLMLVKASGYIYKHSCAIDRSTAHLPTYTGKDCGLYDVLNEHARRRSGRWIFPSKESKCCTSRIRLGLTADRTWTSGPVRCSGEAAMTRDQWVSERR